MDLTQATLQWLNDLAGHGILTTDAELIIRGWSRWLEEHSGHRAEEMIGRPLLEACPELAARGLAPYFHQALAGQVVVLSQRFHHYLLPFPPTVPDAGLAHMLQSVRIAPLTEAGRVVGTITVLEDVTERVVQEKALRESEARYRALAEERQRQVTRLRLLNQIIRAVAERQDLNSIFRVVLQQLEDHLPADFSGLYLYDATADTLSVAARGPQSQPFAAELGRPEGTVVPLEQTALHASIQGETLYVPDTAQREASTLQQLSQVGIRSVLVTPLAVEEETLGLLAVGRKAVDGFTADDGEFLRMLSEHVALAMRHVQLYQDLQRAYEELTLTQRAVMQQERLRALGTMSAGVAHDINNALSPIVGFVDLLLMNEPNLSETAQRYLELIRTAGQDISQTVERMQTFYRKRDEKATWSPVQLNPLVQETIRLTRPRWKDMPQRRGITVTLHTDLDPDLPAVLGVASEIREALTNLIFNAVDALPEGGTITLRTRLVSERARGQVGERQPPPPTHQLTIPPPHVVLEVSDTGVGMDEETRQRCLEPFYTTKIERGTGLGLAMVYGIMRRYEGEIQVESELGRGTTMRLIFPVRAGQAVGLPAEKAVAAKRPLRVLSIDDEVLVRTMIKDMLETDGHQVELAEGGQAGLEIFRSAQARGEPFEVVITDLGMPYVDGREVARTIKQESPTTPVIMLTGWGTQLGADGDRPGGADLVLGKPVKLGQLRQAIAQVMGAS